MSNGFNSMDDSSAFLKHYGVKGMHWGERQYQYLDGSLTPEGKEHYGYGKGHKAATAASIVGIGGGLAGVAATTFKMTANAGKLATFIEPFSKITAAEAAEELAWDGVTWKTYQLVENASKIDKAKQATANAIEAAKEFAWALKDTPLPSNNKKIAIVSAIAGGLVGAGIGTLATRAIINHSIRKAEADIARLEEKYGITDEDFSSSSSPSKGASIAKFGITGLISAALAYGGYQLGSFGIAESAHIDAQSSLASDLASDLAKTAEEWSNAGPGSNPFFTAKEWGDWVTDYAKSANFVNAQSVADKLTDLPIPPKYLAAATAAGGAVVGLAGSGLVTYAVMSKKLNEVKAEQKALRKMTGEQSKTEQITDAMKSRIRSLIRSGKSQEEIADQFGISQSYVSSIGASK